MTTTLDPQKIENTLRQRLESRMAAVRDLVATRQAVAEAKEALKRAEDEDVRRWNAALTAGWTEDELRTAGLPEPEKKARVRKRTPRRTPPPATAVPAPSDNAEQPGHGSVEAQ
ncbi:hypothetical protein GCM10012320_35800 [Sinomonas cellulolyticus]|uniref:Uncharacterized protein n=1 Tax=Sinomonas cellulolyticus TaxID=2801916 RepID=A0ABS1KAU6_9MICC|nr:MULTISPECIES: hypothetical protein [Sinomonas]MBL0707411.1 hypothetical protein [Sinomonas cellulolyticus]GHG60975.1 hypothetical protein GCM10012320_35800 [Sinomonas sp. KCTC 49339]